MKGIKKVICLCVVASMILAMSIPAFAANGARDGTGPSPVHQRLKDGTGGGVKDGSGPLRDGSGGNVDCPYLQ